VISGGPGISSNYLYGLKDCFNRDNLIFFDQIHVVVIESGLSSFEVIAH
jgi:hypothetical protein